jgi:hypothetical protein
MTGKGYPYFLSMPEGPDYPICQIQLAEGLGLFLNGVRYLRTLTDLSSQAVEKFRLRHLQIFRDGVDLDFAGKIARYQVG